MSISANAVPGHATSARQAYIKLCPARPARKSWAVPVRTARHGRAWRSPGPVPGPGVLRFRHRASVCLVLVGLSVGRRAFCLRGVAAPGSGLALADPLPPDPCRAGRPLPCAPPQDHRILLPCTANRLPPARRRPPHGPRRRPPRGASAGPPARRLGRKPPGVRRAPPEAQSMRH